MQLFEALVRGLELRPGPGAEQEQDQQRDQPRLLQLGRGHRGQLPRQDRAVHLHTADRQVAAAAAGVYRQLVCRDKLKLLSLEQHIRDHEFSSRQHQPGHCAVCRNILEHGDTDTQAAETFSLSSSSSSCVPRFVTQSHKDNTIVTGDPVSTGVQVELLLPRGEFHLRAHVAAAAAAQGAAERGQGGLQGGRHQETSADQGAEADSL